MAFNVKGGFGELHSDKLTEVTLCSTWLNAAAQQCSNDVHTAYSLAGLVTAALPLTAGPLLQPRQMKLFLQQHIPLPCFTHSFKLHKSISAEVYAKVKLLPTHSPKIIVSKGMFAVSKLTVTHYVCRLVTDKIIMEFNTFLHNHEHKSNKL